jgi:2-dehydro-3-deoxyphosphogluconate aldolase/(4S)-4-hydroxy-2-oxoglutarate aldolase
MKLPIVGILRGFERRLLGGILGAARRGGLENVEITMNSPGAAEQIKEAIALGEGAINIGAGTVLNERLLDEALAAGAAFMVTPTLNPTVIEKCVRLKVPVFPGALSPTEVHAAWELGATMVKIFPAEVSLVKALRGLFPEIKLMPTGGVDLRNLPEFIRAGASGAGVGSPLFQRERIEAGDWGWLEAQTRAFVTAWRANGKV